MKRLFRTIVRALGGLLLAIVVFVIVGAGAGAIYQSLSEQRDRGLYPPSGQLVDVGGYRMHIDCTGTNVGGSPTVILEAGQGSSSLVWAWIQPEVAKVTRVCAYDRAGIGWSESSPNPRDAQHMAIELHALLEHAKIEGPLILVGHSFGGVVTHVYAKQYPNQVVALVWLDRMHPDQWTRLPEAQTQQQQITQMALLGRLTAPIGLVRLAGFFPLDPDLPKPQAQAFKAWTDTARFMEINSAEFSGQAQSLPQARAVGSLGSLPIIVLTATDHGFPKESSDKLEADWLAMQDDLALLSSASVHRIVPNTTHGSLLTRQKDAQAGIDAIRQLVARTSR